MNANQTQQQKTHWLLVIISTMVGVAAAFHVGKIPPSLPALQQELDLTVSQSGLVVSAFSIMAMLFSLPMGVLSARVGAYKMVLAALVFLGVGGLLTANADHIGILLAARILEGLGYVIVAVTVPGIVGQIVRPKDRALALGIWAAWVPLGIGVMLIVAPLLHGMLDWRSVWMGVGLFSLIWIVVLHAGFRSQHIVVRPPKQSQFPRLTSVLTRNPIILALCFFCYSSLFTTSISFLPLAWHEVHGISIEQASYYTSVAVLMNVVGNIVGGWLVGRQVDLKVILFFALVIPGCLSGIGFYTGAPFALQFSMMVVFILFSGMLPGAMFSVAPSYAQSPAHIPLVVGLLFQGAALGQVVGPTVFSYIVEWSSSWSYGAIFFLLIAAIGFGLVMVLERPNHEELA